MQSITFVAVSLALLAVCASSPVKEEVIQQVPKEHTQSAIEKEGAVSGAAGKVSGATEEKKEEVRVRRDVAGLESDLLPSVGEVDASPFGEISQLEGRGRIRVLPAFLG